MNQKKIILCPNPNRDQGMAATKTAEQILQEMGFTALLTCTEKVNEISGDPAVLTSLGRFNRPSGVSTEKFMRKIGIK